MEDKSPDKIFYNGAIHTMDHSNNIFKAMAVEGGKIAVLGSDKDILAMKKDGAKLYDLKGRTVIPGLVEGHTHLAWVALSELNGEVFIPASIKELLEYVRFKAGILPPGEWIYFPNTYPTRLDEHRFPTLQELDEAAPRHPVYVNGAYAGQANSCALRIAGIDETSPQPAKGKILRDKTTGRPTGLLFLCGDMVLKHIKRPSYSAEELKKGILNIQERYNKLGITSIIDGMTDEQAIHAVNELYNEGRLSLRTAYTALPSGLENADDTVKTLRDAVGTPPQWGRLAFMKAMIDGGILTGTSYMRSPYNDDIGVFGIDDRDFRGIVNYSADRLARMIGKASEHGLQMTAHCIGDAATDIFLDAYELYSKKEDISSKRYSIIHCDFTDRTALKRIKALGLVLLFQPAWHYKDADILDRVLDRDTMKTFMTYREYVESGIVTAAGSDHMIKYDSVKSQNPYNPFLALYNMVTRKTQKGRVMGHEQAISREDALRMYTFNGAFATFDEALKGTLETGKAADFAVLSNDYFNCGEEEIPSITSLLTVIDGKIVHDSTTK